jgi:hypothetical protein
MTNIIRTFARGAVLGAIVLGAAGCSEFLEVENPNVVNADALDPARDAPVLSLSARENFYFAAGHHAMWTSFLVWETWPAETFPEWNQFGLRSIVTTNGPLNTNMWSPLSVALATNDQVLQVLAGSEGEGTNINVARSALFAGYSLVLMSEAFCQSVIRGGPPLTSAQAQDSAVVRFTRAIDVASAITSGGDATEARNIVNAAYVGRARAHLQAGHKAQALADAQQVPAGFNFNMVYADNPASRARLSNRMFQSTNDRRSIVVPPTWRVDDPRIPVIAPPTATTLAADGIVPFYAQGKYTKYDAPQRLASKLEADYIAAEATGTAAMLQLIQDRRAANGQPPYTGDTGDAAVLAELMEQRAREFFLEGKRLGDFRRNGEAVRGVPPAGSQYFKAGYSAIGDQTCFPVPFVETSNNPNFPTG